MLLPAAGELSVSQHRCRLQTRHVCQSSSLLSDKAGAGPGGPDKTEGGGGVGGARIACIDESF